MPGKGTVHALFVSKRIKKEYQEKKSLYMSFGDLGKFFDRVPRKVVKWTMKKKEMPEMITKEVLSLYKRSNYQDQSEIWLLR